MAIEEACGVTRMDCIRQLEHLATEYLDARRLPALHAFAELTRLDAVATDLVASAWDSGYLICVDDIASKLGRLNLEEMGSWIFPQLVGYNSFERLPVWEPAYLNDELNLVRKIEVECYHYYLMPGWLQPKTGFMEFQRIDLGAHVRDVESRLESKLSNFFEIMGYRSKACKVMIEMLEQEICEGSEQSAAPGDAQSMRLLDDGLYEDEKLFVWGEIRYETLAPRMVRVLRLLLDERRKGFPDVSLDRIEKDAQVCITGGMHNQVFKVNRKGWPIGELHPVHKVVLPIGSGVYRLIDPKKVPDKVPDCS
jgi:hypothetical protein